MQGAEAHQLQAILEGLTESLVVFNLGGDIVLVNRAAVSLYEFTEAETGGAVGALGDLFALYDPDGEPVAAAAYPEARLLRGETFANLELWTERRTGGRRWLGSYHGSRVQDSETLLVLSVRDVTAQRELEVRHRATFDVNPTAMSIMRLGDLYFTEVNDSFLELTGYCRGEVVGHTAYELGLRLEFKKRDDAVRLLQNGDEDSILEHEDGLRTQAGELRQVLSQGRIVRFNGVPYLIDTYLDITDRKRSETELLQAVQAVMSDPSWFVQVVQQKLFEIRSGSEAEPGLERLSPRERQVLERLASGRSNEQIAAALSIAPQTIRNYISTIYDKIGVRSRAEAVVWARERGLIFPS